MVLRLGLNFTPAPISVPHIDHIAGVEVALKEKVCALLKDVPRPEMKLSVAQLRAIKSLKRQEEIVILKMDKGNTTVVMDRDDYHQKCLTLLQPPMYIHMYHYQGSNQQSGKKSDVHVSVERSQDKEVHRQGTL